MTMQSTGDGSASGAPPASPRLRNLLIAAALLLLAGGTWLFASAPAPETAPVPEGQLPALETIQIVSEAFLPHLRLAGLLDARRRVELFSEEEGRVLETGAEELERVAEGQLLVRLDPLLAELAVRRAEAAIVRAQSELALASANLERYQGLAGRDATSRAALDEATSAAELARAAGIEARAALAEARDRLAKKTLRAPFAGVLRSFPVEQGEYLRAGERIAELLDVDRLRITIGLTDRQLVEVEAGARVELRVDARAGEDFEGRVVQVGAAMDPATRKFPVRIEVDNGDGRLIPGMVADVDLPLGQPRELISLPRDAVRQTYDLSHVFVAERQGEGGYVARRRRIEVRAIPSRPTEIEVMSGLARGERVIVSSIRQLVDGMPIRPLPPGNRNALTRIEPPEAAAPVSIAPESLP